MSPRLEMDRRSFIEILGGGIVVCVSLGPQELLAQERGRGYPTDVNAYLRIGEDGRVTVFSGKIEMGQGVLTSQAQMLAEELGVALESIDMVLGDTDRCPWDMGTFGSLTTRMFGPALRAAGAEARAVLRAARLGAARRPEGASRRRERRRLGEGRTEPQAHLRRARQGPEDHPHARPEGRAAQRVRVHGDGPVAQAARRAATR